MSTRYISSKDKEKILERQKNRCANVPGANLYRLGDFSCLLWEGTRKGVFTNDIYEFDHIVEYRLTKDNSIDNIQALCPNCHSYRSRNFVSELALAKKKGIIDEYSGSNKTKTADKQVTTVKIPIKNEPGVEEPIIQTKTINGETKKYYMCRRCLRKMTSMNGFEYHVYERTYPCIPKVEEEDELIVEAEYVDEIESKCTYNSKKRIICDICPKKNGEFRSYPDVSSFNKHQGTVTHKVCELVIETPPDISSKQNITHKMLVKSKYIYDSEKRIVCKMCPKKNGAYRSYSDVSSYNKHLGTETHKECVNIHISHTNINKNNS